MRTFPKGSVRDALGAALRERRVVLFCGAGISMEPPATLPDWNTFRDETIKAVASVYKPLADRVNSLIASELIGEHALAPELVATVIRSIAPASRRTSFGRTRILRRSPRGRDHPTHPSPGPA